jgi:predicted DCC family thiol-disulfide oxidoreductase YuxK
MTAPATPTAGTVPVVLFTVKGEPVSTFAVAVPLNRPYTVVYDGFCKVCNRLVRLLRKWDRTEQLEIVASQQPGVQARFPWIPAKAYTESVQLIAANGRTWQGAAAIEHILDVLPKGKLLSWIFSIPFVRPLAEKFYRWFARNRYMLGCGDHCQSRPLNVMFDDEEPAKQR